MTVYIPLIIAICSAVVMMLQGVPKIQENINRERKIYEDAREAVEQARSSESLTKVQAQSAFQINNPYAEFNATWAATAASLGQPEEVSRLIVREAQQIGLRIGNSRLQDAVEVNTLEGIVQSRQFNISVEGSHQQIGQWMARCESLIRTVRPVSASWFPYGNEVNADIMFQLLDDARLLTPTTAPLALPAWLTAIPAPSIEVTEPNQSPTVAPEVSTPES